MSSTTKSTEEARKCLRCTTPFLWKREGDYFSGQFCSRRCEERDWAEYVGLHQGFHQITESRIPNQAAFSAVKSWAEEVKEYAGESDKPGLVLFGRAPETGKTVSAIWAALQIVSWRGKELEHKEMEEYCDVYPSGLFFSHLDIRTAYDRISRLPKEKADWAEKLAGAELLVLDDIDKIKNTEGFLELLFGVIDKRYSHRRTTIVTTNFVGQELGKKWGEEYGPYIVRRLREHCLAVNFDA